MTDHITIPSDRALQDLVCKLVEKYDPFSVVYFGSIFHKAVADGPFQDEVAIGAKHYCLLVITAERARVDHEMQEYATVNLKDHTVTILAHGKDTIREYIQRGNRFFLTVLRSGIVLYPADSLPVLSELLLSEIDHQRVYHEAERDSGFHLELAEGFYSAIEGCLESSNWNGAAFLANQTIEQMCLALNQAYLGYRADIHNIDRLLKLCTCYTQELTPYFPRYTFEQKRLYRLLNAAYNDARYGGGEFAVDSSDAFALASTLGDLLKIADRLCKQKLTELKSKADNALGGAENTVPTLKSSDIPDDDVKSVATTSANNTIDSYSSRQKILDLLVAVIKPAKIYVRVNDGEDWRDSSAHVHFVIIISNKKQDAFKDIDPLIGLARLGDSKLTCSLYQFASMEDKLAHGHVFYSPVCVSANLIYDDGVKVLVPTQASRFAEITAKGCKDFRAGMLRSNSFLNGARYYNDSLSDKAMSCFMLQQAAELTYRTVILVLYGMDVRTHSIIELRRHISVCAPGLNNHLPAYTNEDKRLVAELEDAYTAARYKDSFQINEEAFNCLSERIGNLVDAAIALGDQRFPVLSPVPGMNDEPKSYSDTFLQAD